MTESQDTPDWRQCLTRAQMLIERDRFADAAHWCKRGLQDSPDNAELHALLALSWMHIDGRAGDAVEAARRAVGLEPEDAFNHSMLALALSHKAKEGQDDMLREALDAARKALELDAWSIMAHSAQTQVLMRLRRWREAETSAREALAMDPENPRLGAQLAIILQQLGKHEDHEHLAKSHLEQHPDSDAAHCNAGLNALMKGDHATANKHFLEALRLNPNSELARIGLAESYRARSWFYNLLLRFDAFVKRLTGGREMAFFLVGFLIFQALYRTLLATAPVVAYLLLGAWLVLVFWTSMARGLSSFFMLFDPFARQCLKLRERWEGLAVGLLVFLAFACLVGGILIDGIFAMASLGLFLGATTVSSAFTNEHHVGRWIYAAASVYCVVCPLYFTAHAFLALGWGIVLPGAGEVVGSGLWGAVIFSWVRAFNVMYR
jgi:tetratricopeptide (TPR) repeat protein